MRSQCLLWLLPMLHVYIRKCPVRSEQPALPIAQARLPKLDCMCMLTPVLEPLARGMSPLGKNSDMQTFHIGWLGSREEVQGMCHFADLFHIY